MGFGCIHMLHALIACYTYFYMLCTLCTCCILLYIYIYLLVHSNTQSTYLAKPATKPPLDPLGPSCRLTLEAIIGNGQIHWVLKHVWISFQQHEPSFSGMHSTILIRFILCFPKCMWKSFHFHSSLYLIYVLEFWLWITGNWVSNPTMPARVPM